MLDDKEGVPGIYEALEDRKESGNVAEMQAGGGFVEDEQRRSASGIRAGTKILPPEGLRENGTQLKSLRFPAGEGVEWLSETEITEAQFLERLQGIENSRLGGCFPGGRAAGGPGRSLPEEGQRFRHGEGENVRDGLPFIANFEGGLVIAGAVAFWTGKVQVREKLHLHFLKSVARAALTAARTGIERKISGLNPCQLPIRGRGEELPDEIKGAEVNDGCGPRGAGQGALVHDPRIGELFRASERTQGGRVLLALDAEGPGEVLVEDIVDEGGLAGPGNTRHAGENSQWDVDIKIEQVVAGCPSDPEEPGRGPADGRNRNGHLAEQIGERGGARGGLEGRDLPHALARQGGHDFSTVFAGPGAKVEEMISGLHHSFLMFHYHERVALVSQPVHDGNEGANVAWVQPDGRFVENKEGVGERGPETAGEIDPLNLAPGEGSGGPVESEVAEANLAEKVQPIGDLGVNELGRFVDEGPLLSKLGGECQKPGVKLADWLAPELRERMAIDLKAEGLWLQAGATAARAGGVGSVAAEKNAHVHLVGAPFHPLEKPLHTIPLVVLPGILGVVPLSVENPVLLLLGEIGKGAVEIEVPPRRMQFEVSLALLPAVSLERLHTPLADGTEAVRDSLGEVDSDDAAKPPALRAGPHRVVESEECRCGGAGAKASGWIGPVGGETVWSASLVRLHEGAGALAQVEGALERFEEAWTISCCNLDPVLNDVDLAGEEGEPGGRGRVRTDHLSVEMNAKVALLLEEGEEFLQLHVRRNRNGEENESLLIGQVFKTPGRNRITRIGADPIPGGGINGVCTASVEELQVVVDLGDGPDR